MMPIDKMVALDFKTNWRKFSEKLFELEDADPGYMLLARAKLTEAQKLRYVLAWCTFYNPGIAALASEYQGAKFYEYLRAQYPIAKRASERRHFRGQAGLKALAQWQDLYPKPEAMIEACFGPTYLQVRKNMQHMAQMGDYFYWKLADIQDTVFGDPVDFTGCEKYMPKVPKQGAEIIQHLNSPSQPFNWLEKTMGDVTKHISKLKHPFAPHRPLALQEAETVCCVFKQHVVGDYRFGFRSAKAFKRLHDVRGADRNGTVKALLEGLYAGGIWTEANLLQTVSHL